MFTIGFKDQSISIFLESQAVIRALSAQELTISLVCYEAISILKKLEPGQTDVGWDPGTQWIIRTCGNEADDDVIANRGQLALSS